MITILKYMFMISREIKWLQLRNTMKVYKKKSKKSTTIVREFKENEMITTSKCNEVRKVNEYYYRVLGFPLHWQFLNGLDYRQIHWLRSYRFQCKYACISVKFWSNSDFSKTPITPHVSCHVLVMSWEHNGSIFDAALVGK